MQVEGLNNNQEIQVGVQVQALPTKNHQPKWLLEQEMTEVKWGTQGVVLYREHIMGMGSKEALPPIPHLNIQLKRMVAEGLAVCTTVLAQAGLHPLRFQCTKKGNLPIILVILGVLPVNRLAAAMANSKAKARV